MLGDDFVVEQHVVFVALNAVAAVLATVVMLTAWRRRAARGAVSLAFMMLGVAIWSGTAAGMWYVSGLGDQLFWRNATALGVWMIPVAVLMLAFEIAGMKRWLTPGRIALVSLASFVLIAIRCPNPGNLFDKAFVAQTIGQYTHYNEVQGPLQYTFSVLAFSMSESSVPQAPFNAALSDADTMNAPLAMGRALVRGAAA